MVCACLALVWMWTCIRFIGSNLSGLSLPSSSAKAASACRGAMWWANCTRRILVFHKWNRWQVLYLGILVLYMSLYSRVLLSDSCRGFWAGQRGLPFIRSHHLSTVRHGKIAVCFYQRATRGRTNCLTASLPVMVSRKLTAACPSNPSTSWGANRASVRVISVRPHTYRCPRVGWGEVPPTHVGLQSPPCTPVNAVHKSIHPSGTSINSFTQTFIHTPHSLCR